MSDGFTPLAGRLLIENISEDKLKMISIQLTMDEDGIVWGETGRGGNQVVKVKLWRVSHAPSKETS